MGVFTPDFLELFTFLDATFMALMFFSASICSALMTCNSVY